MDSIGDSFEATHEGTLHYELINDEGGVLGMEGTGIFMPEIKCRLLIPKDNFMEFQRLEKP